jgi:hypothetical protein
MQNTKCRMQNCRLKGKFVGDSPARPAPNNKKVGSF